MATEDLSIINAALTRIGEEPITSLSGTSVGARIANENYEKIVEAHLSVYPWKQASRIQQLSRLDEDTHGEPPQPWTAAYQLPAEFSEIRTVKVGGTPIDYEVHGDTILCDAAEDDEVILHYVWRAAEADWPAWFCEGMIRSLEAVFLRGIGERYREAELREEAARTWWMTAKNRDSQSQTPRDPVQSTTLAARRG
ncbi:MAG: hypothetical protein KJZ73_13030 [Pseudorhodoplanes sp.]|nr:hypothetical protein [Pseudorhodoplanes sp.]